jgi:hypothetical protein
VRVGDEQARVAAGEAVVWPPDVVHSAWTEHTPMRAIVVEFATDADAADLETLLIAGHHAESEAEQVAGAEQAVEPASASAPGPAPAGPSLEPGAGSGLAAGVVTPLSPTGPTGHVSPDEEPW